MIPGAANPMLLRRASGGATDADATAFLSAAGITDPTQSSAVHALAIALKTAGIWTKMLAVYPFVGSTSNNHKYNLKDPRDLDAAYRVGFTGSNATHTSNGVTMTSSVPTYAPVDTSSAPSASFSIYSRTNSQSSSADIINTANSHIYSRFTNGEAYLRVSRDGPNDTGQIVSSSSGLTIANRIDANNVRAMARGTLIVIAGTVYTPSAANPMSFGVTGRQLAFAHVGLGLTDSEMTALTNAVNTYQTNLGRAV